MAAGESAYDVARRQREKAARLARSAELWEKGAEGELEVARILSDLPGDWVAFHDLPWPGRPRANIDHVVIGPGGVFVIDAKNWSGAIAVTEGVLRQNGYRRDKAALSAAEAASAIQQAIPAGHGVAGVLCFIRDEAVAGWSRDAMVCSTGNLRDMLANRPLVLTSEQVQQYAVVVRGLARQDRARAQAQPGVLVPVKGRPIAGSRSRSRRRPVVALLGSVALLAAIQTGAYTTAANWVGERLAQVIVPDTAKPTETRTTPPDNKARNQSGKEKQGSGRP